jgi:MFS family permease
VPIGIAALSLVAFVLVELRVSEPMIEFRLFRNMNFLAANVSQVLAGAIELGLGYMIPFFLLLVIGVGPAVAGLVLLPGTIPIIVAGPLAGRMFDRVGGRIPLVIGFLCLAGSGLALVLGATAESAAALIPGLILQGLGLGIVLTVNDPTGLNSVPPEDAGQAAGVINTTEQMGGAIGIAALSAIELSAVYDGMTDRLAEQGIEATAKDVAIVHDYVESAFQHGAEHVHQSAVVREVIEDVLDVHVTAFQEIFAVTAGIGLLGALLMFLMVRKESRVHRGRVFGRRSRWVLANQGRSGAVTRRPAPDGD